MLAQVLSLFMLSNAKLFLIFPVEKKGLFPEGLWGKKNNN